MTKKIFWVGLFPPQVPSLGDHAQIVAIQKWFADCFPNWKVIRFYRLWQDSRLYFGGCY